VIYNRTPSTVDEDALRACGLSLSRDNRLVRIESKRWHLRVYVPLDDVEGVGP
jgi:hypothetical protein